MPWVMVKGPIKSPRPAHAKFFCFGNSGWPRTGVCPIYERMEYRKLGRTGLQVSELCLGTMQFGWTADEAASAAIMDAFVEAGGNFIDTADIYTTWADAGLAGGGVSEEMIGRWMARRRNRRTLVIATKVRGRMWEGPNGEGLSRARVIRCCEDSLRRLQTDHLDLYQCHWVDLTTPVEETLGALDDLVRAGKVRYLGASNYPAWRLMEALWRSDRRGLARFESYQPEYSLVERTGFELEAMPLCRHHGLGVIPYSPLARGFLTGKYRRGQPSPSSVRAQEVAANYFTESWMGSESDHYKAKLESILQYKTTETSPKVLKWIEEYVDALKRHIEKAKIEEERGDF